MRRLSTRLGVYAILLTIALYGTLSVANQPRKTVPGTVEIIQKAITSVKETEKTASKDYFLSKNNMELPVYPVSMHAGTSLLATALAGHSFFTHSATIQHYISTI